MLHDHFGGEGKLPLGGGGLKSYICTNLYLKTTPPLTVTSHHPPSLEETAASPVPPPQPQAHLRLGLAPPAPKAPPTSSLEAAAWTQQQQFLCGPGLPGPSAARRGKVSESEN